MEYRNVKETAKAWKVSERLVQRLCAEGRIEGARKFGGAWIIPLAADKPEDIRKQWARERRSASHLAESSDPSLSRSEESSPPFLALELANEAPACKPQKAPSAEEGVSDMLSKLMPLLNSSFEPGACQQAIDRLEDQDARILAHAEFFYFSGDAEGASRISDGLLSHPDLAVRLSACLLYAYSNLTLGNINRARFALAELRSALAASPNAESSQSKAAMAFAGHAASILLHIPVSPEAFPADTLLPLFPQGLRSFALYVHAHQLYLKGDYARSLGVAETALLVNSSTYPISEIYLHLVAVMSCMSLKQTDDARDHLIAAWDLARPDGFIEPFGEHHGLLGGMLESVIKSDWPEDFKRIIDITYRFSAGWRRIHNTATAETVADNLTTTEFAVSMLAARGWTNCEIGNHLDISANTVKSYLTSSFRKLGISKRQDLKQFMLR